MKPASLGPVPVPRAPMPESRTRSQPCTPTGHSASVSVGERGCGQRLGKDAGINLSARPNS